METTNYLAPTCTHLEYEVFFAQAVFICIIYRSPSFACLPALHKPSRPSKPQHIGRSTTPTAHGPSHALFFGLGVLEAFSSIMRYPSPYWQSQWGVKLQNTKYTPSRGCCCLPLSCFAHSLAIEGQIPFSMIVVRQLHGTRSRKEPDSRTLLPHTPQCLPLLSPPHLLAKC